MNGVDWRRLHWNGIELSGGKGAGSEEQEAGSKKPGASLDVCVNATKLHPPYHHLGTNLCNIRRWECQHHHADFPGDPECHSGSPPTSVQAPLWLSQQTRSVQDSTRSASRVIDQGGALFTSRMGSIFASVEDLKGCENLARCAKGLGLSSGVRPVVLLELERQSPFEASRS